MRTAGIIFLFTMTLGLFSCRSATIEISGIGLTLPESRIVSSRINSGTISIDLESSSGVVNASISPWTIDHLNGTESKYTLQASVNQRPDGIERTIEIRKNGKIAVLVGKNIVHALPILSGLILLPGTALDEKDDHSGAWTTVIIRNRNGVSWESRPGDEIDLTNEDGTRWKFLLIGATRPLQKAAGPTKPPTADGAPDVRADFYLTSN